MLRFAVRMLPRSPLFTGVAPLALGVGIAANTAIFGLIDAVLLRPMPGVKAPDGLAVSEHWQAGQLPGNIGYPDYREYRVQLKTLSGVAAEAGTRASFSVAAPASAWRRRSGNYLKVLGTNPATGRLFADTDESEGGPAAAVIGCAFCQRMSAEIRARWEARFA